MITLTIPDGRTIRTSSNKRYHVIVESWQGHRIVRALSTNRREYADKYLAKRLAGGPAWLIEVPQ